MAPCCSCNGQNAVCKQCICVRAGRPCTSCLPLRFHRCSNVLLSNLATFANSSMEGSNRGVDEVGMSHMSNIETNQCPILQSVSSNDFAGYVQCCDAAVVDNNRSSLPSHINELFIKAYGAPLVYSDGGDCHSPWCKRWSIVAQHRGLHYTLPSGSISRCYVDQLTEELKYLCNGTYPAERVLVFSSVLLQRDRAVNKGWDIRRLFKRRLSLWLDNQFDVLLQEAQRCDQALLNSYRSSSGHDSDHIVKVFTKLMLRGDSRAAVHWITERSGGGLLNPTESVVEKLKSKHPEPKIPSNDSIPCCDNLSYFEDTKITAAHVQFVAGRL